MTNHRLNVYFVVSQPAAGERQTSITNILVENCNFMGGNQGVVIGGSGPDVAGLNIFVDNITIRNCRHSLLFPQSASFFSANFQIGSLGFGGYANIADCYGEYSGDVGVEVNAVNALVENTIIKDAANVAFFHTNYNTPAAGTKQVVIFRNCTAQKQMLSSNLSGKGFAAGTSYGVPLGTVSFDDCKFNTSRSSWIWGEALTVGSTSGMTGLTIDNFTSTSTGLSYNLSSNGFLNPINIQLGGSPIQVALRNIDLMIRGARLASAGELDVIGLNLGGTMILNAQDMSLDISMTNGSNYGIRGISIGGSPSTLSGTIQGVVVQQLFGGDDPRAILIYGTDTLTITTQLLIQDCNFSKMTSGTPISVGDGNSAKVLVSGNT
jgi:hypothetical protein